MIGLKEKGSRQIDPGWWRYGLTRIRPDKDPAWQGSRLIIPVWSWSWSDDLAERDRIKTDGSGLIKIRPDTDRDWNGSGLIDPAWYGSWSETLVKLMIGLREKGSPGGRFFCLNLICPLCCWGNITKKNVFYIRLFMQKIIFVLITHFF